MVVMYLCPTDCPDDLFNNMKLYCGKYIRVCKEINISFMPQEAQVSGDSLSLSFLSFYAFCCGSLVTEGKSSCLNRFCFVIGRRILLCESMWKLAASSCDVMILQCFYCSGLGTLTSSKCFWHLYKVKYRSYLFLQIFWHLDLEPAKLSRDWNVPHFTFIIWLCVDC